MDKRTFIKTGVCGTACALLGPGTLFAEASGRPWKWSREALYQSETPKGVRCLICPNECTLKEGELSECHNRRVYKGKLYTIAYGNPCAVHLDPIEKKPLYHYLPDSDAFSIATAGCNLACLNCQNWTISQSSPEETENFDLMPQKVIEQARKYNCRSIAYTYSEPITWYEYLFDTGQMAREAGIKNVLVSAGYINRDPLLNLCKVIDAANIDLKSMDDSIYLKLNAGKLEPVLNTLKTLKDEGVWLEITNLVIPSWTDDLDMIRRMCGWLARNGFEDTPLHFSRFHPQYKLQRLPATPLRTLESAKEIALSEGLKFIYIGNVPGSKDTHTLCPGCGEILVERSGYTLKSMKVKSGLCPYCSTPIPGHWS
ncbi:MAG: AmmeMemoRadiSam system radical SAM enzyme [Bacteroidales bacterium]|nr:AmmeMemoRadiSam system radical SAM enzyme [Bacteroidales bacterium]